MNHAMNRTNSNNSGYRSKTHPVVVIKRWVGHVMLAAAGVLLDVENEWEEGEDCHSHNHHSINNVNNHNSHNHSSGLNLDNAITSDADATSLWSRLSSSLSLLFGQNDSSSSSSSCSAGGYRSIPDRENNNNNNNNNTAASNSSTSTHIDNNKNSINNSNNIVSDNGSHSNNGADNSSSGSVSSTNNSSGGGVLWTSDDLWPECLLQSSSPGSGAVTVPNPSTSLRSNPRSSPCPRSVMVGILTHPPPPPSSLDPFISSPHPACFSRPLFIILLSFPPFFSPFRYALPTLPHSMPSLWQRRYPYGTTH